MKIPTKYKVPLTGYHNKGVYRCQDCSENLLLNDKETLADNIIGFADSNDGLMAVIECPKCFNKWYFHARLWDGDTYYDYFLDSIESGTNKKFKNQKEDDKAND